MDYCIATVFQPKWKDCIKTWWLTETAEHPMRLAQNMGVVDAYQWCFERSDADVLAFLHDDVIISEFGWDKRVLKEFEDPTVGLVGFFGAKAHGDPEMYKKPYQLSQLGRSGCLSNMVDAEHHGQRFTGETDVAVLDAFSMFVRREVLEKAGGWPVNTPVDYISPDYWISCMTRRLGYRIRVVGVACQHLSGGSNGRNVKPIDFEGAHRYIYETFKDCLPARVP
ncbi:MAG TPA: glycosyltransferase family 2 protein [Nitrospira sp.]|nr:glycosyltransferase family 2 protein [Nitrospira sp.]